MKTPLQTRAVALLASLAVTLLCLHAISLYAYPECADAPPAPVKPRSAHR